MRKSKEILLTILLAGFSALCGCGQIAAPGEKSTVQVTEPEGFYVAVTNADSTGLILEITNNSDRELAWGTPFVIEKETDGEWYSLTPIELPEGTVYIWPDLMSVLDSNETMTLELQWEALYGKLPKGHYRIVKSDFGYCIPANETEEKNTVYIGCEFTIQ